MDDLVAPERVMVTVVYRVEEDQTVTELDSPVIGDQQVIAQRKSYWGYFPTRQAADGFIRARCEDFVGEGYVLSHGKFLRGAVKNHPYANSHDVAYSVEEFMWRDSELPKDLPLLLAAPQRVVLRDLKHMPRRVHLMEPEYPKFALP